MVGRQDASESPATSEFISSHGLDKSKLDRKNDETLDRALRLNNYWAALIHVRTYASNQEYFDELLMLASRIEQSGNPNAAVAIRYGVTCSNGLTDGWAMLMESLEKALAMYGKSLPLDQATDLESAFEAARKAVYRR